MAVFVYLSPEIGFFGGARTGGNKIAKIALEGPWHSPCRGRAAQKSINVFSRGHNCLSHGPHASVVASI